MVNIITFSIAFFLCVISNKIGALSTNMEIISQNQFMDWGAIPFFEADISWFRIIVSLTQMISVIAAAIYYVFISTNTIKTRKAQLFMQIYNSFQKQEFLKQFIDIMNLQWADFEDYWQKYGMINNPEIASKIHSVGTYLEGIGVLVNRRLIDLELVDELMTGIIERYWEKMEPAIIVQREVLNWPEAYEWTEYLYKEIKLKKSKTEGK